MTRGWQFAATHDVVSAAGDADTAERERIMYKVHVCIKYLSTCNCWQGERTAWKQAGFWSEAGRNDALLRCLIWARWRWVSWSWRKHLLGTLLLRNHFAFLRYYLCLIFQTQRKGEPYEEGWSGDYPDDVTNDFSADPDERCSTWKLGRDVVSGSWGDYVYQCAYAVIQIFFCRELRRDWRDWFLRRMTWRWGWGIGRVARRLWVFFFYDLDFDHGLSTRLKTWSRRESLDFGAGNSLIGVCILLCHNLSYPKTKSFLPNQQNL